MTFNKLIPGCLSPSDIPLLQKICNMSPPESNAIEVGPYAGRTTQVLKNIFQTVYAIDPWEENVPKGFVQYGIPIDPKNIYTVFDKHISFYNNVKSITGYFPKDYPEEFKNNIGCVYIDLWSEDSQYQIFSSAWDLLMPGGIICGKTFLKWTDYVLISARQLAYYRDTIIFISPGNEFFYMVKPDEQKILSTD